MKHIDQFGWQYKQHMQVDMMIARKAGLVAIKAFIHALFPNIKWPHNARNIIRNLENDWIAMEESAIEDNKAQGLTGDYVIITTRGY